MIRPQSRRENGSLFFLSIGVWEILNGQGRATLLLENIRYLVFVRLGVIRVSLEVTVNSISYYI